MVSSLVETRKTEKGLLFIEKISELPEDEKWRIPSEPVDAATGSGGTDSMDIDEEAKPAKATQKKSQPHQKQPTLKQQQHQQQKKK